MARDSAAGGLMMRFVLAAVLLVAVSAVAEADERQTFNDYLKAAEGGDVHAQARVGILYEQGKGTPQNDALAFAWFRKAAEGGDVHAQGMVGSLYKAGRGVPQDYREAMRWLSRAAERGYSVSQAALGGMYEQGLGVTKDSIQAYKWDSLAAVSETIPQLREAYAKDRNRVAQAMTPEQITEAQRLAREWKPTAGQDQRFERTIDQCVQVVRQRRSGSDFDAYASGETVHSFGNSADYFQFKKCMVQHGQPLK